MWVSVRLRSPPPQRAYGKRLAPYATLLEPRFRPASHGRCLHKAASRLSLTERELWERDRASHNGVSGYRDVLRHDPAASGRTRAEDCGQLREAPTSAMRPPSCATARAPCSELARTSSVAEWMLPTRPARPHRQSTDRETEMRARTPSRWGTTGRDASASPSWDPAGLHPHFILAPVMTHDA